MKIIIEGPDNSGKSVLASELASRFGWKPDTIFHHKQNHEPIHHMHWLVENDSSFIADRLYWSEQIYGRVIRNRIKSDGYFLDQVARNRYDVYTIICIPQRFEFIEEKFQESEEYPDLRDMREIYDLYRWIWYGECPMVSEVGMKQAKRFGDIVHACGQAPLRHRRRTYLYSIGIDDPANFAYCFHHYLKEAADVGE